ncbi:hypothetical protein [Streptococcus pacificus]|uniref:Uncharacterized protein n=1 Tax=Streptococcus pacificus TaxID=2740577 RepID=A0ABS0ZKB7_9STRE|nr:hypothetical protein [Streptococcus pacificus]MBJ8326471.1 hypothetical protein [Streptococcus pacificus]
MTKDFLIIYFILGIVLAGVEIYLVKNRKINRWFLPIVVWIVSIIVAIPFSATFGAFSSLMQLIMLGGFYIEDWLTGRKNNNNDKMRIRNL